MGLADHRAIGMVHGKGAEALLAGIIFDVVINVGKINADLVFLFQDPIVQQDPLAGVHIVKLRDQIAVDIHLSKGIHAIHKQVVMLFQLGFG